MIRAVNYASCFIIHHALLLVFQDTQSSETEAILHESATEEVESMQQTETEDDTEKVEEETQIVDVPKPAPKIPKRKKHQQTEDPRINEAFDILKNVSAKSLQDNDDECGVYGKHVANKLRNYNKRTRAIVQYHFNNIMFQADLGQFDTPAQVSITPFNSSSTTPIPSPSPQSTVETTSVSCDPPRSYSSQSPYSIIDISNLVPEAVKESRPSTSFTQDKNNTEAGNSSDSHNDFLTTWNNFM